MKVNSLTGVIMKSSSIMEVKIAPNLGRLQQLKSIVVVQVLKYTDRRVGLYRVVTVL